MVKPLTADSDYTRFFIFYLANLISLTTFEHVLKITRDIKQQDFTKTLTHILSSLNNFHSLDGVDSVGETQLQVACKIPII